MFGAPSQQTQLSIGMLYCVYEGIFLKVAHPVSEELC